MMLMAILNDNYFHHSSEYNGQYDRKWTVRAFAYDTEGKLVLFKLHGRDFLGKHNCIETIGGKIKNDETTEEALRRVIEEDCGYSINSMQYLGYVVDHYNALNRETISNYFVVELGQSFKDVKVLESDRNGEVDLITIDEDQLIPMLKNVVKGTFDDLITRRDLIAFKDFKQKQKRAV